MVSVEPLVVDGYTHVYGGSDWIRYRKCIWYDDDIFTRIFKQLEGMVLDGWDPRSGFWCTACLRVRNEVLDTMWDGRMSGLGSLGCDWSTKGGWRDESFMWIEFLTVGHGWKGDVERQIDLPARYICANGG